MMAINNMRFDFLFGAPTPLQWAMALLLLFTFVIITKAAYQRLSNAHLWHRSIVLVANIGVFICVLLLASEVSVKRETTQTAVLITPAQNDTTTSLVAKANDIKKSIQHIFVLREVLDKLNEPMDASQLPRHWQLIEQPEQIFTKLDSLQHLQILGDGLTQIQLDDMQDLAQTRLEHPISIEFTPPPAILGLVNVSWQRRLAVGQTQQITGQLQIPQGQPGAFDIALVAPSGETISRLQLGSENDFDFVFMTQTTGPQRYTLDIIDSSSKQVVKTESITFDNFQADRPDILIRQSSPSFETRHIKNWAAEFGSRVTIATQISQSKFIVQQVNRDDENLAAVSDNVSATDWQNYDLLIIDGRALTSLTEPQQQDVYAAMQAGLGILVIADESLLSDEGMTRLNAWVDWDVVALSDRTQNDQTRIFAQQFITQLPIPTYPARLNFVPDNTALEVLFRDKDNSPLVVNQSVGKGQLAVSLINSSYQWKLSSQLSDFSRYWQTLLQTLSRPALPPYWLPPSKKMLSTDSQRVPICALLDDEGEMVSQYLTPDNTVVSIELVNSVIDDNKHCSQFWPVHTGWYVFQLMQNTKTDSFYWFHHDHSQWPAWRQANKQKATSQHAAQQRNVSSSIQSTPMDKLPVWAVFILLSALLWIERKFYADAGPSWG
ncbi:hypothetical protein OAP14_11160 [Aliiglaciecola sp.]|nr:hypothetical protein [Aliiglaciecola sp.]